jgi:electron transfer flavoprotein beta subunit
MKILVSSKRVTDPDARIKVLPDGSGIDTGNVEYKVNPFCENAIEEAVKLAEEHGAETVAVAIGDEETVQYIRQAMAMGVDRGIRVDANEAELDSDIVARVFAALVAKEQPDLVLLGKQAIDGDSNQVGQLLAEYLGWPQACFASKVELHDGELVVAREVDGGLERMAVSLPAVLTADLRLNEPRYASLPGIMKAKRKPLEELSLDEIGVDATPKVRVVRMTEPPKRKGGTKVPDVDALVSALRNEARVI